MSIIDSIGEKFVFNINAGGSTEYLAAIPVGTDSIVVFFRDSADGLGYRTATLDGNEDLVWAPKQIIDATPSSWITATAIDTDRVAVIYGVALPSKNVKCVVGTFDGTNLSWGTEALVVPGAITAYTGVTLVGTNKLAVVYKDSSYSPDRNYVRIGTISGNTTDWSAAATSILINDFVEYHSVVEIDANRILVSYHSYSTTSRIVNRVYSIDGSDVAIYESSFNSTIGPTNHFSIFMLDSARFVICSGVDGSGPQHAAVQIGTLSGNNITYGDVYDLPISEMNDNVFRAYGTKIDSESFALTTSSIADSGPSGYQVRMAEALIVEGVVAFGEDQPVISIAPTGGNIDVTYIPSTNDLLVVFGDDWTSGGDYSGAAVRTSFNRQIDGDPFNIRYLSIDAYSISSTKGNIRGKAAAGFYRPTITEFFTSVDFEEIKKTITAKSVVLDFANNWGKVSYMGVRSVEFKIGGELILLPGNFTDYFSTEYNTAFSTDKAFNTGYALDGSWSGTSWMSGLNIRFNQRIIVVFNDEIEFDEIVINNTHTSGTQTDTGVKDTKIHSSTDAITNNVYNAIVPNSKLLFDGQIPMHGAINGRDDFVVFHN